MTLVAPPAPAAPLVTAGDGSVKVTWTAPEFDSGTMRAVVGYVLHPYIGTTVQAPLDFDVTQTAVTLTKDGDGRDIENGAAYTFRVAGISSVGLGTFSPHSVAVTPSPTSQVALTAESWDYNATRLAFNLTEKMRSGINTAVAAGFAPRIAITRSGYGRPTTPLDGDKLFDMTVEEALVLPYHYDLNDVPNEALWVRPPSVDASLYDRNLQQGRWYYYTLFLFLKTDAYPEGEWAAYASDEALVPIDYHHRDRLWETLPDFYRVKDEEFLIYPNTEGDLKRFLNVFGFELDYTRTIAEGVQDIYQVERSYSGFVQALGETNLGSIKEEGLGEIRYRALVAVLNYMYSERGTERGIKNLASVTSKYRAKVAEGINRMRESDDSEFNVDFEEPQGTSSTYSLGTHVPWKPLGAGNWATPYLLLIQGMAPAAENIPGDEELLLDYDTPYLGGLTYRQIRNNLTVNEFATSAWPQPVAWANSPGDKKIGGLIKGRDIPEYNDGGVIICCGAGVSRTGDRYHNLVPRLTFPSINGIRCKPGGYYDWSLYSERVSSAYDDLHGTVSIGVMWFGAPKGVNATDLQEFPMVNDDAKASLDLPGFKTQYQHLTTPTFGSLGYISRDERVWVRSDEAKQVLINANDGFPYSYPVTIDDETDSMGVVYDPTTDRLNPKRYSIRTIAPLPSGPEEFVYAVPYVAFSDARVSRYIGCAMFNEESNPRNQYIVTRAVSPNTDDVSDGSPVELDDTNE